MEAATETEAQYEVKLIKASAEFVIKKKSMCVLERL